jgi:putative Holliday junction resolvase
MANTSDTADDPGREDRPNPPARTVPAEGALLGIDYGSKRLGFAVCDREQTIASPVENYDRQTPAVDAKALHRLIEDYRIVGLIVGLPVHMSGEEGTQAREARQFGEWAAEETGLPLQFWDERFSSHAADAALFQGELTNKKHKARRDMLAARAILQSFLDADDRSAGPADLREGQ